MTEMMRCACCKMRRAVATPTVQGSEDAGSEVLESAQLQRVSVAC